MTNVTYRGLEVPERIMSLIRIDAEEGGTAFNDWMSGVDAAMDREEDRDTALSIEASWDKLSEQTQTGRRREPQPGDRVRITQDTIPGSGYLDRHTGRAGVLRAVDPSDLVPEHPYIVKIDDGPTDRVHVVEVIND